MKKICIMHQASIGDTLLASPVYRAVKENFPDTEVIAVTSPVGAELFRGNPYIDTLVEYKKGGPVLPVIKKIWRADAAVILDYHYRNALFAFLAVIPKRIGRGKDFINFKVEELPAETFEPKKYLSLLEPLGISSENLSLTKIFPTDEEKNRVAELVGSIKKPDKKLVIIVPYSLSPLKDWPSENYREIIRRIEASGNVVAILGGKNESELIKRNFAGVKSFAGETNLRESAEIISLADLQISGCTSMLHLCSTTSTPAVALYGPTTPAQWAPKKNCTVISKNLPCSPCYNVPGKPPCTDNKCIKNISVDEVWAVVKNFL